MDAQPPPDPAGTPSGREEFLLPPVLLNEKGAVRKAGFEFEFAGVSLYQAGALVKQVFGGEQVIESTFKQSVRGARYGDFSVEIDSTLLKEKRYEKLLRAVGVDVDKLHKQPLEKVIVGVANYAVPFEIGAPPIPMTELAPLEDLRRLLHEHRAEGTRRSLLYQFGLHINPESPRVDAPTLLNYLRAFLLLYPWLEERVRVDLTRRMGPYINPFPAAYARGVLAEAYPVTADGLIDDYVRHNPTRNRPLDMLPILACLDKEAVHARVEDPHLVKPRPAFHYRMPNCLIDEPDWTLAKEWNTWLTVERLAAEPELIARMAREYLAADEQSFGPFGRKWPALLANYIGPLRG